MLIKMKNGEGIRFDNDYAFATLDKERIRVQEKQTMELVFWAPTANVEYWIKKEQEQ